MMTDSRNKGNYERYLSQTHECKVLSKPELAEVLKNMQFKQVQKGQHLIDQYDVRNYTFFLKKGFFKTESVNSDCGSSFMSFLCPEMVFPLRGMDTDRSYYYTATALTDAEVVYIPRSLFDKLRYSNHQFSLKITKQMDDVIAETETFLQRTSNSSAKGKIEQALRSINEQFGADDNLKDGRQIPFPITIKELSYFCGVNRKTTSLVIRELVRAEKISYTDKYLFFPDFTFET